MRNTTLSLILMCVLPLTAGAQSAICLEPGTSSVSQLNTLNEIYTATGANAQAFRARWGIGSTDPSVLTLVTNDTLCAKVDSAVMRAGRPQRFRALAVYRMSPTTFAAFFPRRDLTSVFFISSDSFALVGAMGTNAVVARGDTAVMPPPSSIPSRASWVLTASSTWSNATLAGAVDASLTSKWTSGTSVTPGVSYFQADLGTAVPVGRVLIDDTYNPNDIPLTGDVRTSLDGTTYTTVKSWTASNISGGKLTIVWPAQTARFVKLVATSGPSVSGNWFTIADLQIYSY